MLFLKQERKSTQKSERIKKNDSFMTISINVPLKPFPPLDSGGFRGAKTF